MNDGPSFTLTRELNGDEDYVRKLYQVQMGECYKS